MKSKCENCGFEFEDTNPHIRTKNGDICMACEFKKIDVWRLSLKGEETYMVDENKENLQQQIDEDDENEYDLEKDIMKVIDYYNMPEFEGF